MAPEEHFDLEELARAGDRPRPLRPEFRARLETELHAQIASDKDAAPRPLNRGTAERLADALSGPSADEASSDQDDDLMTGLLVGVDGPRPLPESLSDRLAGRLAGAEAPRWRRVFQRPSVMRVAGGIAAAALIVAGISAALLSGGSGSGPGTVASRSNGAVQPNAQAPASGGGAGAANGQGSGSGFGARSMVPGSVPSGPQGSGASAGSAGPIPAASGAAGINPTASSSAPAIYSVTPASGPAGGGTWVTITGIHFTGTTSILFGNTKAPQFAVLSDQEVKAVSPAHLAGAVDIEVVTPTGSTPLSPADNYQYTT
jgi:hypothetical protein